MNRVLVIGSSGQIGYNLSRKLTEMELEVMKIDKVNRGQKNFKLLNVRNEHMLTGIMKDFQPDTVFNLAAEVGGVPYIEKTNYKIMHNNLTITKNVVKACLKTEVDRLIHPSSTVVYPDRKKTNRISFYYDDYYVEKDVPPYYPEEGGYGFEKATAEQLINSVNTDYGTKYVTPRLGNTYGPWGPYKNGREKAPMALLYKAHKALQTNSLEIEILGDGTQVRAFTYVMDTVEALVKLAEHTTTEPLNIQTKDHVTIYRLATIAADIVKEANKVKTGFNFRFNLNAPTGPLTRLVSPSRAKEVLGWEAKTPLENGLRKSYLWMSWVEQCEPNVLFDKNSF